MSIRLELAKPERRVYRSGSSLVWQLPVEIQLEPGLRLNVYIDDDKVCYTTGEPPGDAPRTTVVVRVARRSNRRVYTMLTIPSEFAKMLGIREGDIIHVDVEGDKVCIRRVA